MARIENLLASPVDRAPDIIRTATNLVPPEVKDVRIVDIIGLDQQADGGTHVASTRQVGWIEVVKVENKAKVSVGSVSASAVNFPDQ